MNRFQEPEARTMIADLGRAACRALESGHPENPLAGLTARPGSEAGNRLWTA
jgi:hypothetical protein